MNRMGVEIPISRQARVNKLPWSLDRIKPDTATLDVKVAGLAKELMA